MPLLAPPPRPRPRANAVAHSVAVAPPYKWSNHIRSFRAARSPKKAVWWSQLPEERYLCTRFGPRWGLADPPLGKPRVAQNSRVTYTGRFSLTLPAGKRLRFHVAARHRAGRKLTHSANGLPPGARYHAATGRLRWKAAGKPGQIWTVKFRAATADGKQAAAWSMDLRMATAMQRVAWRFVPVRGQDCEWVEKASGLTAQDLNDDGHTDYFYTRVKNKIGPAGGGSFTFYHTLKFGRPRGYMTYNFAEQEMSAAALHRGPDGSWLVVLSGGCCCQDSVGVFKIHRLNVHSLFGVDGSGNCSHPETGTSVITDKKRRLLGARAVNKSEFVEIRWKNGRYREVTRRPRKKGDYKRL